MRRFYFIHFSISSYVRYASFLLSGIILGCLAALYADGSVASMMRMAVYCPVSIVSLSAVLIFPFFPAALAVVFHTYWPVYLIGFCKGFSYAFCAIGLWLSLGREAGFTAYLLLLPSAFQFLVLTWFSLGVLADNSRRLVSRLTVASLTVVAVVCVYVRHMLPLLVSL